MNDDAAPLAKKGAAIIPFDSIQKPKPTQPSGMLVPMEDDAAIDAALALLLGREYAAEVAAIIARARLIKATPCVVPFRQLGKKPAVFRPPAKDDPA